jgi:hypothetical protein
METVYIAQLLNNSFTIRRINVSSLCGYLFPINQRFFCPPIWETKELCAAPIYVRMRTMWVAHGIRMWLLFREHGLYWAYKIVWAARHNSASGPEHFIGPAFGVNGRQISWPPSNVTYVYRPQAINQIYTTYFGLPSRYAMDLHGRTTWDRRRANWVWS